MEVLAFAAPLTLLALVVGAQLFTVFEPFLALHTEEGAELLAYHARDLKLRLIAEYWAAKLLNQRGGWYDHSNNAAVALKQELHYYLVRHRFLYGDDPATMRWGPKRTHSLLTKALKKVGLDAVTPDREHVLFVEQRLVKDASGQTVWRGRPAEYKSRFNDMYYEE
jgi:hypothetical protein